jgi:hypothetical protein
VACTRHVFFCFVATMKMNRRLLAFLLVSPLLTGCMAKGGFLFTPTGMAKYANPEAHKVRYYCDGEQPLDARILGCPNYDAEAAKITKANANNLIRGDPKEDCLVAAATSRRHFDLMIELLDNGANFNRCREPDLYFLWVLSRLGPCPAETDRVFSILQDRGIRTPNPDRLLSGAIRVECFGAINYAIKWYGDLNRKNELGHLPLFYAMDPGVKFGADVARLMIRAGADPLRQFTFLLPGRLVTGSVCEIAELQYSKHPDWTKLKKELAFCGDAG